MNRLVKITGILLSIFIVLESSQSFRASAQADDPLVDRTMDDVMVVVGTTAGGAVLGLSTLSFVSRPSRHIRNIVVGAAFGIIVGVMVVAYGQADRTQQYLGASAPYRGLENFQELGMVGRIQWEEQDRREQQLQHSLQPQVGWSFSF